MSENTTLVVTFAQPNPEEIERFQRYVATATELSVEAGAVPTARFGVRSIIGDVPASVFGFASFPSVQSVHDVFDSDAYQAIVADRDKALEAVNAYIVEDAPLTDLPEPDGVYLVIAAAPNPEHMADLQAYQAGSGPIFAKHGARPVTQLPVTAQPVGDTPAAFVAVLEFDSAEAVEAVFADPDYQELVPARDRGLAALNVYVTT